MTTSKYELSLHPYRYPLPLNETQRNNIYKHVSTENFVLLLIKVFKTYVIIYYLNYIKSIQISLRKIYIFSIIAILDLKSYV